MSKFSIEPTTIGEKKSSRFLKPAESAGKITDTIGQGENAKNSIVFLTIMLCFILGAILTSLIAIDCWWFPERNKAPDFIGNVKIIWEIFIPIITLSLGYAFGKSQK